MGHSQVEKAQSRERVVKAAARRLREGGISGLSIDDVMADAGLTRGGFYGHFESRNELIAEALKDALGESRVVNGPANPNRTLERIVSQYLSPAHRDAPGTGCAVSALASEVVRADPRVRSVMESHLKAYSEGIGAAIGEGADRDLVIGVVCLKLGALTLARLVEDEAFSDEILASSRRLILSLAPPDGSGVSET